MDDEIQKEDTAPETTVNDEMKMAMEQARKQVLCMHKNAQHEWTRMQDFVLEDDGCSHTYTLVFCDCGASEMVTYMFQSHK